MLNVLLVLSLFIVTISLLVIVHEAGHFFVARWCNIKVISFSIGFGKALFQTKTKNGIIFKFCWIPLGGYVHLYTATDIVNTQKISSSLKHEAFNHRPVGIRALVMLAGPMASILLAIVMYTVVFTHGYPAIKPVIGGVNSSITAKAGLKSLQTITAINGKMMRSWTDVHWQLLKYIGRAQPLFMETTSTNGVVNTYQVHMPLAPKAMIKRQSPLQQLGIVPLTPTNSGLSAAEWSKQYKTVIRYPLGTAIIHSVIHSFNVLKISFIILSKMLTGWISLAALSGPLGIAFSGAIFAEQGWIVYLQFMALLSISLGFMNLLPIPLLDGGHLFYYVLELILRRPLSVTTQIWGYRIGGLILLGLLLIAAYNDLTRLWN